MKILSHFAMATALLSAGALVNLPQVAKAQEEESATPQLQVSKDFLASYETIKASLDAGDAATAQAGLPSAEAAILNDSDQYVFGDLNYKTGVALKDKALEIKGIDIMLDSQFLPPTNRPIFLYIKGGYANSQKDYAAAISNFKQSYDLGFRRGSIETFLGIAYSNNNQPEEAISWYELAAASLAAQGRDSDVKKLYGNMVVAAIDSQNSNLIDATFLKVLPKTMDKNLWHDGLTQFMSHHNFSEQETLDVLRLMRSTESLLFANEYAEYAEAADPRRLPNEVVEILKLGESKGHIESNDITFKEFNDAAKARISADKADLPAAERDAKRSATGNSARSTGDALLSYGEYARAITMYKLALEKGVTDVDRTRNRLGIALLKNGDFEEAKTNFSSLTTPNRKKIGKYWLIHANSLQKQANSVPSDIAN